MSICVYGQIPRVVFLTEVSRIYTLLDSQHSLLLLMLTMIPESHSIFTVLFCVLMVPGEYQGSSPSGRLAGHLPAAPALLVVLTWHATAGYNMT